MLSKNEFPILEYDDARVAVIEPSNFIEKRDVPAGCVFCFFQDVLTKLRDKETSYHYLPPIRIVIAATLTANSIPDVQGRTWTADAPYRETRAKIDYGSSSVFRHRAVSQRAFWANFAWWG